MFNDSRDKKLNNFKRYTYNSNIRIDNIKNPLHIS